ncbi:TPA: cellulase family glycosylhydrolase, partial [Klebsiella pneumoniae]|nr:cellulase family glycosylhydrolase [Klebsiella pneumoniae]
TWDSVEKNKGVYAIPPKLKLVDEIIRGAKKYNISPLVILDYGNKNYNNGGYPANEQDIAAFAKYAKWVASNYKGQVKYYEIWNEWTVGTGMKGKGEIPPPQIYLELVKKTSQAIKSVDPSAIILAGSFNPLSPTGRRLNIS